MKARVVVTLKSGVLDPQGKAIEGALASLGIEGVTSVRQGKVFDLELDGPDPDGTLRRACERLLANTVVEDFRFAHEGGDAPAAASADATAADAAETAAQAAEMPAEGHP